MLKEEDCVHERQVTAGLVGRQPFAQAQNSEGILGAWPTSGALSRINSVVTPPLDGVSKV